MKDTFVLYALLQFVFAMTIYARESDSWRYPVTMITLLMSTLLGAMILSHPLAVFNVSYTSLIAYIQFMVGGLLLVLYHHDTPSPQTVPRFIWYLAIIFVLLGPIVSLWLIHTYGVVALWPFVR